MHKFFSKLFTKVHVAVFIAVILLSVPFKTHAATLSLSPSSLNANVGGTLTIRVNVNTVGKSINNGEATINFPTDLLEVVSISKSSSIFSLWIEEPSYSNTTGRIAFNGGVASPGFNGSTGTIANITFKAKKQGSASIIFSEGAVRENDGLGTDILTSKSGSVITIGSPTVTPEVPVTPTTTPTVPAGENKSLSKPIIKSETNPDQEAWYSSQTASFNWTIPSSATSIQTLYNKSEDSTPTITYDSSVTEKTLFNLPDRTFYFHLRYLDGGKWSPVAHYKFQIDSTAPNSFTPTIKSSKTENIIVLNATDETSGVDYYSIKIDGSDEIKVKKSDLVDNEYVLPIMSKGSRNISVIAYDKAGNNTEGKVSFTNSLEISAPELTLSIEEIQSGDFVTIFGKGGYPNKDVEVTLEHQGEVIKVYTQKVSADGTFTITTDDIKSVGEISIYAENVLSGLIRSEKSENIYLQVIDKNIINLSVHIYVIFALLAIFAILFILMIFGWAKYLGLKRKIRNGEQYPVDYVYKTTMLLKEELDKQLRVLDDIKVNGVMNKKEEKALNRIQKKEESIIKDMQKRS